MGDDGKRLDKREKEGGEGDSYASGYTPPAGLPTQLDSKMLIEEESNKVSAAGAQLGVEQERQEATVLSVQTESSHEVAGKTHCDCRNVEISIKFYDLVWFSCVVEEKNDEEGLVKNMEEVYVKPVQEMN